MENKDKIANIITILKQEYPDARCCLDYKKPHELLIATRLSAQCTDKRVNMVTVALFEHYQSVEDFANADILELEEYIKSCGLFKTKARSIIDMCTILHSKYDDIIPSTVEELVMLPGVGRKTANLVCGDLYGKPGIVTDTHVIRLSNRLGLVNSDIPYVVEKALVELVPPSERMPFCHRLVWQGRAVCTARKPQCEHCPLAFFCSYVNLQQ